MGMNVNAVAPGFVDTEMTRDLKDEQREQIVRRSALKRLVEVEDVANAVEFLLSDRAKNITGAVILSTRGTPREHITCNGALANQRFGWKGMVARAGADCSDWA
jgi:NAD(P)-dependent dehydrogenase (short-subunit alcohol dehydrogenase family)